MRVKAFITALLQLFFTLVMYCVGILIIGVALFPGIILCYRIWVGTAALFITQRILFLCFGIAASYFIYGITLVAIVGMLRFVLQLNLKDGDYPLFSWGTVKWAFANSLYLLVATTFMDFMLLTPFATLFYRLMGAKLGKNVQINSKFCADISLLEVGDGAVIGGHATVICHSFERNRFILKKVKIGKHAIIGLNAVILPGCEIGDGALIAAGAVLAKNTKVEPRDVYFGVPAESAKGRHTEKQT
jgi:acetyltransferase-like isoleucine patch superfamily enzyme